MNKRISQLIFTGVLLVLVMTTSAANISDQSAPDCALIPMDGAPNYNLQTLQGKVVYVDFWASWCPPCVRSFPFMNQLDHDLKDKGLHVVAVNLDEKLSDAKKFLANHAAEFSVVFDPDSQCAKDFGVMAMPSSYVIDRNGVIRHIHLGFRSEETDNLRLVIEQILNESL